MGRFLKKLQTSITFHSRNVSQEKILFLKTCGQMLDKGFSIKQALEYVQLINPHSDSIAKEAQKKLEAGYPLHEALLELNFPKHLTSQVYLAEAQGNLSQVLMVASKQLEMERVKKKELFQLLQYPTFLLIFLIGMILAIRSILLPQLLNISGQNYQQNPAVFFVHYFPHILAISLLIFIILLLFGRYFLEGYPRLERMKFLIKIPLLGRFYQLHLTYRLTREWSLMFASGLNMKEIIYVMQVSSASDEMQAIGHAMGQSYLKGWSTSQVFEDLEVLSKETSYIIQHGERVGNVSQELEYFSELTFQRLSQKLNRLFQMIQPILFIFIALLIVTIFIAMMTPMMQMMETL